MPQKNNLACFMDQRVTQRSSPPNTRNEIRVPTRGIRTRAGRNVPRMDPRVEKAKTFPAMRPTAVEVSESSRMINGLVIARMTTGTEIKTAQMTKAMMIL